VNREELSDLTAAQPNQAAAKEVAPGASRDAGMSGTASWLAIAAATHPARASRSRFEQTLRLAGIALFEYRPDWTRDADGLHGEFSWCGARYGIVGIAGPAGLARLLSAVAASDLRILLHALGFDLSRESARQVEFRVSAPNRDVIDLACEVQLEFGVNSRASVVSGVLKDVTERRRVLGRMANEISNLVQPVAPLGRDMLNLGLVTAEGVSQLEIVLEYCRKAGRIAGDVRAFARRARRRGVVMDMRQLLEACMDVVRVSVPADVSVVLRAPAGELTIFVDRIAFTTMLLSLAVNAAAAMDGRGELVLALDETRQSGGARFARLRVIDPGCGMDQATLSRAFEPFFTTRPAGLGSGLGLSVAQALVTEMCGAIAIESAPAMGTTVTVTVPVHEE
jgi:signal transduction histidine kinase